MTTKTKAQPSTEAVDHKPAPYETLPGCYGAEVPPDGAPCLPGGALEG